jgi:hypothetical protein
MTSTKIPYVDRMLDVDIPDQNLIFDVSPRDALPAEDFEETLK